VDRFTWRAAAVGTAEVYRRAVAEQGERADRGVRHVGA
jgi:hypothetical protein